MSVVVPTILGFIDVILDLYYVFTTDFYDDSLRNIAIFSLVLSPIISFVAWTVLFTKEEDGKCIKF